MTDASEPNDDRNATMGAPTPASMAARMLVPLAGSAATSVLADRLMATAQPDELSRAVVSIAIGACLAGVALAALLIRPMLRARTVLQDRYHAAVADALSDPLTGLGNHRAFQEELERQTEHALRYSVPVALVLIDLDEFKQINDTAGHASGDQTLASFGALLAGAVRRVDRPFRIGGDEFAVLLPHTDVDGAHIVARRLLVTALQPTVRDGRGKPVSFSAGISALPSPAGSRAQLYTQADAALYAAKHAGRTEVIIFDPDDEGAVTAAGTSAAIADVIARGLLRPVFQPIVELASGATIGYEGLIRPLPPAPYRDPASLFAAAEESGHVVALDLACVEAIVAGARDLPFGYFLSVNLSPRTIEAPEFSTAAMLSILARHHFAPDRLVIELTERQPIADIEAVRHKLETCRRAGMRLAADDLGAGNSGLRLLSDLTFDIVKVDLGLVQRSSPDTPSSAVVESIVAFATRTGAMVIGEGVEHEGEVDQLTQLGVEAAQGYLFSRPGPLPDWGGADLPAAMAEARRVATGPSADSGMDAWRQSIGLPSAAA